MEGQYRKILIVNLGGIGDLMLSSPALKAVRSAYPSARLYLLTSPQAAEYGRMLTYIDKVSVLDPGHGILRLLSGLPGLLSLRGERFDLAVNMRTIVSGPSQARMRLLFRIIAAARTAGRDTAGRGDFFDIRIQEDEGDIRYEMEYDLMTAQAVTGEPPSDRSVDFSITAAAVARVAALFGQAGLSGKIIGIHLGGKQSHTWPAENFFAAAEQAGDPAGCSLVLTGEAQDGRRAAGLIRKCPLRVLDLTGKLSLAELGEAIRRCSVYITSDTAPMHIAAVLKTPLVAVFGPGYLRRFDPRNISERCIVLYKKAECAPCDRVYCSSRACLTSIPPSEAAEAAAGLLKEGEPA